MTSKLKSTKKIVSMDSMIRVLLSTIISIISIIGVGILAGDNIALSQINNVDHNIKSYQFDDFTVYYNHQSFSIIHLSTGIVLSRSDHLPMINLSRLQEKVNFGDVTLRFRASVSANSVAEGPLSVEYTSHNKLILTQKLSGQCSDKLLSIFFQQITQASIEVVARVVNSANNNHSMFTKSGKIKKNRCFDAMTFSFSRYTSERFLGLGTQYTNLNLSGYHYTTLSQEQGHGRGLQPLTWLSNQFGHGAGGDRTTSYNYVPHIISSFNRSLWLNSIPHSHFDFTDENLISITTNQSKLQLRWNQSDNPRTLLKIFGDHFGTMKRLPSWVHTGAIIGLQGGNQAIESGIEKLRSVNAKFSSLWIQDWIGSFRTFIGHRLKWHWNLDRTVYPDWEEMIEGLQNQGIKILTYFSPRFTQAHGCTEKCNFSHARDNDYLIKDRDQRLMMIKNGGFEFAKLDLSNPQAVSWYKSLVSDHLSLATINGWMADFSESLPFDAAPFNGIGGEAYHNQYIYDWAQLNGQMIEQIDQGFVFSRSGTLGSHKHVHGYWLGDQLTSWDVYDGLHSTIIGLISSGLSGAIVNHSDVGGLTSLRFERITRIARSKELFIRWLQMNSFTPILRTHEGLWPDQAHQFYSDQETLKLFGYYSNIYAALHSYRERLLDQAMEEGLPLVRGMFVHYPQDYIAWKIDDQFMLGEDLIIAPIIHPGASSREVYLPCGQWYEVFSKKKYIIKTPRYVSVSANLYQIPVFARYYSEVRQDLDRVLKQLGDFSLDTP